MSKRSAQKWSRLLDAMDRRSRELYAEAADEPVTPRLLRRPICQILGGHDWEKRGTPVVETVPVVGGYAVADSLTVERIKRIDVHTVEVPARPDSGEECQISIGRADDAEIAGGRVTVSMACSSASDITVGDLVTFTGEVPYFACRRCGFVGESQWDDERPPTPSVLRGLDALMWWIEHRHEQNGWHWLPKREQSDERAE